MTLTVPTDNALTHLFSSMNSSMTVSKLLEDEVFVRNLLLSSSHISGHPSSLRPNWTPKPDDSVKR